MTQPDAAPNEFEALRPRLVRLAYRMLGSMSDAEDVMQEAWLRWQRADHADVREPAAYLHRTVTRLCLDFIKSARTRREIYVGSWLPEPVTEPEDEEMRADELTLTLMVALERLSSLERAAFLLYDVFQVPVDEVATTLERDTAAIRQLAARARKHVREAKPRYQVDRAEGDRIAQAFFKASASGDVDALRNMLAANVVLRSDGGGKGTRVHQPNPGHRPRGTLSQWPLPQVRGRACEVHPADVDRWPPRLCQPRVRRRAADHRIRNRGRPHYRDLHHPQSRQARAYHEGVEELSWRPHRCAMSPLKPKSRCVAPKQRANHNSITSSARDVPG